MRAAMVTSSEVNILEQAEPSRISLPMRFRSGHGAFVMAIVLAVGVIGWAILNLVVEKARFELVMPGAQASVEAAAAIARLFGALVFILFPQRLSAHRARWIATGLIILGFGGGGAREYFTPNRLFARGEYAALRLADPLDCRRWMLCCRACTEPISCSDGEMDWRVRRSAGRHACPRRNDAGPPARACAVQ